VFSYMKYTYPPVTRHKLTKGLLEEKSSKYSTRCRENPKETRWKYAGPFAGVVVFAYLKDREFTYTQMLIDKFFAFQNFAPGRNGFFPFQYFLLQLLCLKLFHS